MQRVSAAFRAHKVPLVGKVSVEQLGKLLDYVMMSYILEVEIIFFGSLIFSYSFYFCFVFWFSFYLLNCCFCFLSSSKEDILSSPHIS